MYNFLFWYKTHCRLVNDSISWSKEFKMWSDNLATSSKAVRRASIAFPSDIWMRRCILDSAGWGTVYPQNITLGLKYKIEKIVLMKFPTPNSLHNTFSQSNKIYSDKRVYDYHYWKEKHRKRNHLSLVYSRVYLVYQIFNTWAFSLKRIIFEDRIALLIFKWTN